MSQLVFVLVLLSLADSVFGGVGNVIPLTRGPPTALLYTKNPRNSVRAASDSLLIASPGNGYPYYANISLGTPPQNFSVIIDTGSADLLVFGAKCNQTACLNNPTYNPAFSYSSQMISCANQNYACDNTGCGTNAGCTFHDVYGSAEAYGIFYSENFTVGAFGKIRVDFGYIYNSTGLTVAPESGIWGFASYNNSGVLAPTAFDRLVSQTGIKKIFSLCLMEDSPVMTIGIDYNTDPAFTFTPLVPGTDHFSIKLAIAQPGAGAPVSGLGTYDTIVDSGTWAIVLPKNIFTQYFQNFISAYCGGQTGGICSSFNYNSGANYQCYSMSAADVAKYPPMVLTFQGQLTFSIPASNYFFESPTTGRQCLGIIGVNIGNVIILGNVFMQKYHVVFDQYRGQIGFGENYSCPAPTNSGPIYFPVTSTSSSTSDSLTTAAGNDSSSGSVKMSGVMGLLSGFIFLLTSMFM